jgi:hypothetical protein
VQDSRRRIWIDARERRFASFDELNAWLADRCRALWQEVMHPEHKEFSVAEMLEHERLQLMPMPAAFDGYVEEVARVSSTSAWCRWPAIVIRCRASWLDKMVSTHL